VKTLQGLISLVVLGVLLIGLQGQALADPLTTTRASNGALCTADMVYQPGSTPAPYFLFRYEGPHGIATIIFRLTSYLGYPAVYADRVILGNGTNFVLNPFGPGPVAVFGTTSEYDVEENGQLAPNGNLSLFAVGADLQRVLATAVENFCEDFDPAYFAPGGGAPPVASSPTPAPSR
jgi:hypothetical protein